MVKFDIDLILKDLREAIKKEIYDLLPYQITLIFLYLEQQGFTATEKIPLYLSIYKEIPKEIEEFLSKLKTGKKIIVLNSTYTIYYDNEVNSILIEEQDKKNNNQTYVLLTISSK